MPIIYCNITFLAYYVHEDQETSFRLFYLNVCKFFRFVYSSPSQVVSTTSNLTVIVSAATAGRYRCKATTSGFGELTAEATVYMKRAPVISSPRIQHGTPSDTVRLECVASSVPVPDRIVWTYHGTIIGTRNDQNYYSVSTLIRIYYTHSIIVC